MISSSLSQHLGRLRDLQRARRHDEAFRHASALLQVHADSRDLWLIQAIALRNLGRVNEALAVLDRLEPNQPQFSRLFQERGLCHLALGDRMRAIDAFSRAVRLNPALPASWSLLEELYRDGGSTHQASDAAKHVALLGRQPMPIVAATSLLSDGEVYEAQKILDVYVAGPNRHPEALRLLAKVAYARDDMREAELLLSEVLSLAPGYAAARFEYAETLARRRKYAQAQREVISLTNLDPDNPSYRTLEATIAAGLGEFDRAVALYRDLLAADPASPELRLWLGHTLKTMGRLPESIDSYHVATSARASFGEAYWGLANLKTYRFGDDEIAQMRREEASSQIDPADRIAICFALGKALEDRGDSDASWAFYERGNALKRARSTYRPEHFEAGIVEQMKICTRAFFDDRAGWGIAAAGPIFIVGLPRSGSTLLEQILASHSMVEAMDELVDVPRLVRELQGDRPDPAKPRYPAALVQLSQARVTELAEDYLSATKSHRTGKPLFIDKMPNNFRHIGLIHLMFPNARIIDARREPMACCFSNLKQLYAEGQEFSYSMHNIARYYRSYLKMMEHWDAVIPGRILRVHYEDVVDDLEGAIRRLLDYCGLPFEPACVTFYKTQRDVRTPSSEQVRQNIFRNGLTDWKKYEQWLAPLRVGLGDANARYR